MKQAYARILAIFLAALAGAAATPDRRDFEFRSKSQLCHSRSSTSSLDTMNFMEAMNPDVRGGATNVPGWEEYNAALDKHPLWTKSVTALVGWALGDLIAQGTNTPINNLLAITTIWLLSGKCCSYIAIQKMKHLTISARIQYFYPIAHLSGSAL